jgi:mannose-6-phosphate isomerase
MPSIRAFTPYEIPGKPWGTELVVAHTDQYLGKVLWMKAGHGGAFQLHEKKDETFYLLLGKAMVKYRTDDGGTVEEEMRAGEAYHVPPGAAHQVTAIEDCVFVEASTPVFDDRLPVV